MVATVPGLSSVGIIFSYGVETTAGTKPTAFTILDRCNTIGGVELSADNIDASALEDEITRYIKGRLDTGGDWEVTFNLTDEVEAKLDAMISASETAAESSLRTWYQVSVPKLSKAFFIVGEPSSYIPMPEMSQNTLLTVALSIAISEYIGLDAKVTPNP